MQKRLTSSPYNSVLEHLAARSDLYPFAADILHAREKKYTQQALAKNGAISRELLVKLLNHKDMQIVADACINPNLTAADQWDIWQGTFGSKHSLLRRDDLLSEIIDEVLADNNNPNNFYRIHFAKWKFTPAQITKLWETGALNDSWSKSQFAYNPYLSLADKMRIAETGDVRARGVLASKLPLDDQFRLTLTADNAVLLEMVQRELSVEERDRLLSAVLLRDRSAGQSDAAWGFLSRKDVEQFELDTLFAAKEEATLNSPLLTHVQQQEAARDFLNGGNGWVMPRALSNLSYNKNLFQDVAESLLPLCVKEPSILRSLANNKNIELRDNFPAKMWSIRYTDRGEVCVPDGVDAATWTSLLDGFAGTIGELKDMCLLLGPDLGGVVKGEVSAH